MVRELRRVLVVALGGLALMAPASAEAAPTGSIAGAVTDAKTHAGIEGVEVCAYRLGGFEEGEEGSGFVCELTGSTGAYVIEELEPGEYEVEFWPGAQTYFGQYYEDFVTVAAGPVTGVDAELEPSAGVTGTVTAAGQPVEEALVCAWPLVEIEEEEGGRCAETSADGSYGIWRLRPNDYRVEFRGGGNLAPQYYDHKGHWSEATPVTAALGTTKSGVDATLVPGGEIRGAVVSSGGTTLPEILVCAIEAAGTVEQCDETGIFGQYALGPLASGPYKVGFSVELGREFFGEEAFLGEKDGFQTRFYNERTSLAAADPVGLVAPAVISGIDARLISSNPPAAVVLPAAAPTISTAVHKTTLRCKSGFRKKKVKGKQRCVKIKKRHHRKHRAHAREWQRDRRSR